MALAVDRRSVLKSFAALGATSLITTFSAYPQVRRISISTYIYKKTGGLEIKADVYRAEGEEMRPVVIWIHGGALIMGSRRWLDARVKDMMLDSGYVLVSVDYRLAPETKLPLIIEDIEDAYTWVYKNGSELFHADTSRIAIMGASAGGYLTLTAGFRAKPRPSALVSFYGYGDLIGNWYTKPSPHARHHENNMSREEAYRQVSGPPISEDSTRKGNGGAFYDFCRQHGLWPKEVSDWDPYKEKAKFYPYMPVKNVTPEYPPTLLIHGTDDTDVPYEQSVMMAEELEKHGVAFRLITIPGAEHGLGGGDPKLIEDAYEGALSFVNQEMQRPSDSP